MIVAAIAAGMPMVHARAEGTQPEVSEQTDTIKVIMTEAGTLHEKISGQSLMIKALSVEGPVDKTDFRTLLTECHDGQLSYIDLERATVADGRIPDYALFSTAEEAEPICATHLERLILPADATEIGDFAVAHASGLRKLDLPSNVEIIGESAFIGCGMRFLVLPPSVRTIGKSAFDCKSIWKIWCNSTTPPVIDAATFGTFGNKDLYVPGEALSIYDDNVYWKNFQGDIIASECFPKRSNEIAYRDSKINYTGEGALGEVGLYYDGENVDVLDNGMFQLWEGDCDRLIAEAPVIKRYDINTIIWVTADFGGISLDGDKPYTIVIPAGIIADFEDVTRRNPESRICLNRGSGIAPLPVEGEAGAARVFDLNGNRVSSMTPGNIYISNGRKHLERPK